MHFPTFFWPFSICLTLISFFSLFTYFHFSSGSINLYIESQYVTKAIPCIIANPAVLDKEISVFLLLLIILYVQYWTRIFRQNRDFADEHEDSNLVAW